MDLKEYSDLVKSNSNYFLSVPIGLEGTANGYKKFQLEQRRGSLKERLQEVAHQYHGMRQTVRSSQFSKCSHKEPQIISIDIK